MSTYDWPNDNQSAACLTFDLDADEIWNLRIEDGNDWDKLPIATRGEFGPNVAVPRILEVLEKYGLKATFFIPGKVAEDWPETVEKIHDAGHEIGHHGYRHVNPSNFESRIDEEEDIKKALDIFDNVIGETPVGYRSPAGDLSNHTLEILADNGIKWESSFIDSDLPYELDEGLVEIPFDWSLDDWPYFGFNMYPSLPYQSGISPTQPVFESWEAEFDGMHKRNRVFMLTMHPQIIGRAGRIDALENLIQHMLSTSSTWITSGREVAEYWESTQL